MRDYFADGTVGARPRDSAPAQAPRTLAPRIRAARAVAAPLRLVARCVAGRVLLSPPGSDDVLVSARVASGASAGPRGAPAALDALDARVALRWQPVPGEPGTFAEVKAGAVGVLARCSCMHTRSGAGVFALASTAGDTQVGLRYSGQRLGLGLALLGDGAGAGWGGRGEALGGIADALPPHVAWAVARAGRLTFGIERRPVLGAFLCAAALMMRCIHPGNGRSR